MDERISETIFAAMTTYTGDKCYCELVDGVFIERSSRNRKSNADPCEVWCSQTVDILREYCDVIKMRIFWPILFQSERNSSIEDWWNSQTVAEDCWKKVCEIDILEGLVDLVKKVVNIPYFIGGILEIGSRLEKGCCHIGDAIAWVRDTGDINMLQRLGKLGGYSQFYLEVFFAECSKLPKIRSLPLNCSAEDLVKTLRYEQCIINAAVEDGGLVKEFKIVTCEKCRKLSESLKQKGNKKFSQGKFDAAILSYSKAIKVCPTNHILYGNRALCLIHTRQYKRAIADGKRATLLKPDWPKGHYHLCKALSLLGEHNMALEANEKAQKLCKNVPNGLNDLIQQNDELKKALEEMNGIQQHKQKPEKSLLEKKGSSSSGSHLIISQEQEDRKKTESDPTDDKCHKTHDTKVPDIQKIENKGCSQDFPPSQGHQNKGRPKTKPADSEKTIDHLDLKSIEDKLFSTLPQVELMMLQARVQSLICKGCVALMNQRYHNAEQAFSELLSILKPSNLKQLNLHIINYVVIIYGHATALLGIGQPEALKKAEDQFKKIIEKYQEERFDCLAYYGIGNVYLRQNRFSDALDQFMKSQAIINHKIVPGVLTWPTTYHVIEETQTENLQLILKKRIEECKFPPEPDAVCRYQQCHGHSKIQIFFTDPDFKGFIRFTCCQQCRVEFHISCWKKLKTAIYSDKNDKDFLQELCFTPDCTGLISKIAIFSSSGLVKCEFEQKITKPKEPPRTSIKQKCSSLRKLKMKQEKKNRRKRAREEAQISAKNKTEENQMGNEPSQCSDHCGYIQDLYAGDRVLQHISRNAEQLKIAVCDTSKLLKELLSWFVITEEDYMSYSKTSGMSHEVVEQLISYLIQEKSRVKTRSFIHVLSELEEVDPPKLHKWLKHLNNLGLTATKKFLLQYEHFLKELDLSIVIALWNEKYGSKFDYVAASSEDQEIHDYFLKPPLEKSRCFIWLLEDNRENFPFLHQALDEFFDKMDDPSIVLKKQENENISTNGIKVKNKNRKKNSKDPKSILVLSSGVSTAPREEEKIFIEENTLDFTNCNEQFRIPEYLREQLEEFEALSDPSNCNSFQRLLENNPDQTCEILYEYFSQILEEHGPMEINNKLLVGEFEHFPEETRKIVEDEGGLKYFLLKSFRFIMVDDLIALRKHEVIMRENTNRNETGDNEEENYLVCDMQENSFQDKLQLNPDAEEFQPWFYPIHISPSNNLGAASYETQKYLTCAFPASCKSVRSLHTQNIDNIENTSPFSDLLVQCSDSKNPGIFLPQTFQDCESERILPMLSPKPLVPDVAEKPTYIYTDDVALQGDDESVISDRKYVLKSSIPTEIQTYEDPQCQMKNLDNTFYEDNFAVANSKKDCDCGIQVIKKEKQSGGVKNSPHTRMIAVQVNHEVADRENNTLPFHPFESQQGDILRVEKEHQVLREQFKEAQEKYELLQTRSSEEISALKELLKKSVEETEVSKNELDWFHQDLEMQVKKWQQEKKENQQNLKALRNTAKKHTDTNDRYSKTIDEKEKQYNAYLNTYLETSNKFANDKVKLEDLIKKSQDDFQQCVKRAVEAEISVLKNWKEAEISKINGLVANAEANLKMLKSLSSSSSSAAATLKSNIDFCERFLSKVKEHLGKVEAEYEEKIQMVKNGGRNCLTKVESVEFVLAKEGRPPFGDPAIIMYSSASAYPHVLSAFSNPEDQGPTGVSCNTQARVKPRYADSKSCSVSGGPVKTQPKPLEGSHSDNVSETGPSGGSGSHAQNVQPNQNHQDYSKMLPEAFQNIVVDLQSIFPNYSSSDLICFIKDVCRRNGNTLSGLSSDEILSRVTDLILDQQNKAPTPKGRALQPVSSASPVQTGTQSREVPAEENVPSPPKARPAHKNASSKNPPQPNLQPWGNVGAVPKSKWKKMESTDSSDETCAICYDDELNTDSCELECGHLFHRICIRKWITQQSSTCPVCRVHALLPEEFPELPVRNKHI